MMKCPLASTFTFSVSYQDNDGCPPSPIVVRIQCLGTFSLKLSGGDLVTGATFRVRLALPAGRRWYVFEATSGSGVGLRKVTLKTVDPAEVVVLAPPPPPATPPPTPKPIPTPKASQVPAPTQRPTPTPTSGPHATSATPSRDPGSSGESSAAPAAGPVGPDDRGRDGTAPIPGLRPSASATIGFQAPWLALFVASIGALVGLIGFALLSTWLADPAPGRRFVLHRRRGRFALPPRDRQ